MKILKTSALAAVLALGSFSANATIYDGTASLTVSVTTAAALTATLKDEAGAALVSNAISFADLVDGDTIDASLQMDVNGTNGRSITCTMANGLNQVGSSLTDVGGVSADITTDGLSGGTHVTTLTFAMSTCTTDATAQIITLDSSAIENTAVGTVYTTGSTALEFRVAYDTSEAISDYT